ncbi:MAG TPA: hemolysin family protein [Methanobacterium sp.]|nr:hemolysin family protein [Methanobacterium sp.]
MNGLIYIEIMIIIVLIILNGIFALSEIAIITSRKMKLQKMSDDGNKNADIAIELADSPNQFLSTIQICITLIGILAGAFGVATVARALSGYFVGIPFLNQYGEAVAFIVVVLIITYLTLIIGELVPKRIALNNPEKVAVKIARPMKMISSVTKPLVLFLSYSMDVALKLLQVKSNSEEDESEEEIKLLIAEGTETGEFKESEEDIIKRVFTLDDRRVKSLMIPKTEIAWLDVEESAEEIKSRINESKRTMFPLSERNLDNLLGVIQLKDIYGVEITSGKTLKKYMKNPVIVPESSDILDVLKLFKESTQHVHMALIIDEYGSVEGLITLYDILEAIVGDIPDIDEPEIVKRTGEGWLVDGAIQIDEFKEIIGIEELPGEEPEIYNSLAGFILHRLGRVPETGEIFKCGVLQLEIVDMDGHQIDKVLVTLKKENEKTDDDVI